MGDPFNTVLTRLYARDSMGDTELAGLATDIQKWAVELGFQQIGVAIPDVTHHLRYLDQWLERGCHGDMQWMADRRDLRANPATLWPGTLRVLSARMDYLPDPSTTPHTAADRDSAWIARYALGRDYHKTMKQRLIQLAERINAASPHHYRAFVDSAPILERSLAEKAGLGWIGKNTMLINSKAGSWFFLGEILTNLPLSVSPSVETGHCGSCSACLDACPTAAFDAPWQLDARRCIAYLTIEHKDNIPEVLRPHIGNHIFGCDICQQVCPWNKFAMITTEADFKPRKALSNARLIDLFSWDEIEFHRQTAGSPLFRLGHERWLRNIAVALGNIPSSPEVLQALELRRHHPSPMVQEHVAWALAQHERNN